MKQSEKDAILVLEKALNNQALEYYTFDIQDYFADDAEQLDIDNPQMADYLQDIIPEFTDSYTIPEEQEWLSKLKKIIEHAKSLATDNQI
ncbi:MAG TPA: hypothetical protein VGM95_04520 [Lactobacillaceae bacterium]|jgi:hypothetical protein